MGSIKLRHVGFTALLGGLVLLFVGLLADVIGVGDENSFGSTQVAMTAIGAVVASVGLFLFRKS